MKICWLWVHRKGLDYASAKAFVVLAPNGNAVTDFEVAGFARIREFLRGHLKSGDISYDLASQFCRISKR